MVFLILVIATFVSTYMFFTHAFSQDYVVNLEREYLSNNKSDDDKGGMVWAS